jgi:hypothetical protein
MITIPTLLINDESTHRIAKSYRIAIGDVVGNIQHHKSGILETKELCLYAGLVYGKPWTRDAAINIWNGFGILSPEISKNTLLAQVGKTESGEYCIIGQYWDKIIWSIGAWSHYLYSGDKEFLRFTYATIKTTLAILEKEEFSEEFGLFRGPAVYGDGVAAYPEIYTNHVSETKKGSYSCIEDWQAANPNLRHPIGKGIPMHALSTNAVYYKTYVLLSEMTKELGLEHEEQWCIKAEKLRRAINSQFWNDEKKSYNYLIDPFGNSDAQESLGIAFSLLFEIATDEQRDSLFETTVVSKAGIPCVYPCFERYRDESPDSYGRHSGTVWPHIQGFWADAAMKYGRHDLFLNEFNALTSHSNRDFQFVEIYHPVTGKPYGGVQEPEGRREWFCGERQTWSATAYLRMIYRNILGIHHTVEGIVFKPFVPDFINNVTLLGMQYRNSRLDLYISGSGSNIESFTINGVEKEEFILPHDTEGKIEIKIKLNSDIS